VTERSDLAQAIREAFLSPNVVDPNWEPSNLVDVGYDITKRLERIAGALERIAHEIHRFPVP
jgi:hypothetical protein